MPHAQQPPGFSRANFNAQAILDDPQRSVSGALLVRITGALTALGYPRSWQSRQILREPDAIEQVKPRARVEPDLMRSVLLLAAAIGDRPATPATTGLTQQEIDDTLADATLRHRFVPACYDENWDFIESAPASRADNRGHGKYARGGTRQEAANRLRLLAHFVTHGGSGAEIIDKFGPGADTTLRRARDSVRLFINSESIGTGSSKLTLTTPKPGQRELIDLIKAAWETYDSGKDHDPITVWKQLLADARALRTGTESDADPDVEREALTVAA